MSEPVQVPVAELQQSLDEESLREWVQQQRWYASKSRAVAGIEVVEGLALGEDPPLFIALVQTRFATGTHELYQLPLLLVDPERATPALGEPIAQTSEWAAYDAVAERGSRPLGVYQQQRQLVQLVRPGRKPRLDKRQHQRWLVTQREMLGDLGRRYRA